MVIQLHKAGHCSFGPSLTRFEELIFSISKPYFRTNFIIKGDFNIPMYPLIL